MRVVLDTNCLLSCIGKRSPYRSVFDAYLDGRFDLCITSEVLLEYEEKFEIFWGSDVTRNLMGVIVTQPNTLLVNIHFNFYLIESDPDDDKFTDTYLSAGADILVSNDKHILGIDPDRFPFVRVMRLEEFCELLQNKTIDEIGTSDWMTEPDQ